MKPAPIEFAGAEANRLRGDHWVGDSQPILLLHGGGQTRHAWRNTGKRLAERGRTIISIDLRGHGTSDWASSGDYRFEGFASDLDCVATEIADRFSAAPTVVGASLGGISALGAALRHDSPIGALILVDVTPRMDTGGIARIQGFMSARMNEGFVSLEEAAAAVAAYLPNRRRPSSLEGLRKNLRLAKDGRYRWHWDPAFITSDNNINNGAIEFLQGLEEALPGLDVPTLLVRGVESELVREEHVAEFVRRAPHVRSVDVSGAGHMVAGDRNDAFCDAILDFVANSPA